PHRDRRRDVQGGKHDLLVPPDRRQVRGRCRLGRQDGAERRAHHAPAGAVAPVRQEAESLLRRVVGELGDAEDLRGGVGRRGTGGATPHVLLDRARHGHRGRASEAGNQALAEGGGELRDPHDATSSSSRPATATPSRSSRWSPTRSALAMAVSAGFTALDDGKKLVSTTYRLSSSCALQFTSRAELAGSSPKRTVPLWCATPASGMR